MRTINVSRLWGGIPAYYVLSVLGTHINLPGDRRLWEIQTIEIDKDAKFHLIHLETEEKQAIPIFPTYYVEGIKEYLSNPKNLLIFTHRLLDRVMQYEKVMQDISSQYFEHGRKRKYLDEYIRSHPLGVYIRETIRTIIGTLNAEPPLVMWILEALREHFPLRREEIKFKTSDGEERKLIRDQQISDFPRFFAHYNSSPDSPSYFSSLPYYYDEYSGKWITDLGIRNRIFYNQPVHSLFISKSQPSAVLTEIAIKILRFIDKYLLTEFEEILDITLQEAYYSSWTIGTVRRSIFSYPNVAEAMIVRNLKEESGSIIAYGIEGSEYLCKTTIKEFLQEFNKELKS